MPRMSNAEEIRELRVTEAAYGAAWAANENGATFDEVSTAACDAAWAALESAPRCAVCGGPFADGSGCEFCPAVGTGAVESAAHDV